MTKSKDNRTQMILFRVSPREYEEINENREKAGLRLSEYARMMLTGETVVAAPPADLNILIREIKRVGSNLNQIAHRLNAGEEFAAPTQAQLQDLMAQLYQMRKEVAKLTGEYRGEC